MALNKTRIVRWLWETAFVLCAALFLLMFFVNSIADFVVNAAVHFVGLMIQGVDEQAIYPLMVFAVYIGLSAGIVGFRYLATSDNHRVIATAAASLVTVAAAFALSGWEPSVAFVTGIGSFGCFGGLAAYRVLAKKLPSVFNRETVSYIIFGVLTTVVSFVSQMLFASLGTPAFVNTIGSWVCAVIFAYVVNKLFVFESHTDSKQAFLRELWLFIAARLASLGMELVFMVVTVDLLGFSEAVCKLIAQVFILVANYVFSKLIIFRKPKE